ncbi:MAG: DUF1919 domain-containing protein [Chloroflexi bacterium]|nr:DUF1919 domain-containing protein [Chloroflexota bacterium]
MYIPVTIKRMNIGAFKTAIQWRFIDKYFSGIQRSKLKNKDFTIVCNNCIAGGIYHKLGLKYSTPTVGLFFFSSDYLKLLENFEYYIKQPLKFRETSVHPKANELRKTKPYPIGVLGDEVEIQFLHYKDEAEAADKWMRRTKRINFDNLFFIYSDAEEDFKEELLRKYQKLPFEHKLFFSSKPLSDFDCLVFIEEYEAASFTVCTLMNRKYEKHIDVIKWLNYEKDYLKTKQKADA